VKIIVSFPIVMLIKNDERYGWSMEELMHDTIKLVSCSAKVAEIEATQHFVSEVISWVVSWHEIDMLSLKNEILSWEGQYFNIHFEDLYTLQ
jgi:hypothetical protein